MPSDATLTDGGGRKRVQQEYDLFSPCPGCGVVGFTIQVWHAGVQMMQCDDNGCRVEEYRPRVISDAE